MTNQQKVAFALKSEAYRDRLIHFSHKIVVKVSHLFAEPFFVDGPDLLKEDHRILLKSHAVCVKINMGRQLSFPHLAGDRCRYYRGAVLVANVVLHDEHGPHAALLASHYGTQIRVVYISPFNVQSLYRTFLRASPIPLYYTSA